jgi:hypothetical protein
VVEETANFKKGALTRMKIIIKCDEFVSKELMEKAKGIKHYNEFAEIANEYGWKKTLAAFYITHIKYNEYKVEEILTNECFDRLIQYVVEDALEAEKF